MQLSFPAAYTGNLHLYAVDWDSQGRRETITVNGAERGAVKRLQPGRMGLLPDQRLPRAARSRSPSPHRRPNAVLSGIFLGDAGPPPGPDGRKRATGHLGRCRSAPPAMTWPAGTAASDLTSLPNATLTVEQASRYMWAAVHHRRAGAAESRPSTRAAATYYDPNEIQLQLSFTAAYSGNLHLYAVDWDSHGRREIIRSTGRAQCSRATSARAPGSPSRSASRPGEPSRSLSIDGRAQRRVCRGCSLG